MITYKRYHDKDFEVWEEFIDSAYNSTIFHYMQEDDIANGLLIYLKELL